ncbi:MAG TPA: hypothetical protein VFD70_15740 [Anaerolineae bacterium]|nr:hypothetical protein [Anaerolineae bacterium]
MISPSAEATFTEPSPAASEAVPLLNIFALPSRTTLLFGLILLVIFLPLVWGWGTGTPVCVPCLLGGMVILPFRRFLRLPQREVEKHKLKDAQSDYPLLVREVMARVHAPVHIPPVQIFISPTATDGAFARGSFTRRFLAFAANTADQLTQWLESDDEAKPRRADALILHELAHFREHDVELTFFAQSVLAVTVVLMSLALFVHLLTPALYYRMLTFFLYPGSPYPDMLRSLMPNDPTVAQMLDSQNVLTNVQWGYYIVTILASFVPLIIGSAALWVFYWRALVRTRELYADARVVQWQAGNASSLWEVLWIETVLQRVGKKETGGRTLFARWRTLFRFGRGRMFKRIRSWLATHPSDARRQQCFDAPHEIYGDDWSIGLAAGAAVLLLNFNLSSLFLSQSVREPNSVPPFALGFVVITISLLPFLCHLRGALGDMGSRVRRIVLIFTGVNLIPLYVGGGVLFIALGVDPNLLQEALEVLVRGALPSGFANDWIGFFLFYYILTPVLLYTFFMPLFLGIYILAALWVIRRVLRWYAAPFLARHSSVFFWYVIMLFAVVLIFVALPFLNKLTEPTAYDLSAPDALVPMILVGFFGILNAALFFVFEGRYRDRCPTCNETSVGDYFLGKRCTCGELFNAWLVLSAERTATEFSIQ